MYRCDKSQTPKRRVKCTWTTHLKLSSQYLTSSHELPELIQNISTWNLQTQEELSSPHKKIINHNVKFLLSRQLSMVASVILISAYSAPEHTQRSEKVCLRFTKKIKSTVKRSAHYHVWKVGRKAQEGLGRALTGGSKGAKCQFLNSWEKSCKALVKWIWVLFFWNLCCKKTRKI